MIRVCLVDDQTLVRQGIRRLLELADDIEVAGEAADGEEALAVIPEMNPDVVLLDMRMPKVDGIGVLEGLRDRDALPPTLILTTFDDDEILIKGLRAGARGFMLKDVTLEDLTHAVRTLAEGGTLIQPTVTARIRRGIEVDPPEFPSLELPDPLTARETEVLRLMAGGYSNAEIGGALHVATGTVKNHISSILSKLGVRDRTRAVLKAIELGFI